VKAGSVFVEIDVTKLLEQLTALRLLCSQIGFALDGTILALTDDIGSRCSDSAPGQDVAS